MIEVIIMGGEIMLVEAAEAAEAVEATTKEAEAGILVQNLQQAVHLQAIDLVLEEVVEVQVVGEILVSAEMIGESANLVTAELPRIGTAKIERLHCVSPTLEDDREELRIVELSEKETGQLRERPKPRLLRSVERLFYQKDLFRSPLLLSLLMKSRLLSSST